jgi:histidinol-phosphate aminotransferase
MSNRFQSLLPAHIQNLVAYDPGYEPREVKARLGLSELIELGSNENSFGPAPAVKAYLQAPKLAGFRYPDAGGRALKTALAAYFANAGFEFAAKHFTLGNGTHELLTLIAETFCNPGDEVVHAQYGFAVYRLAALGAGATPRAVSVNVDLNVSPEAMLAAVTPRTKLVYLANPNNPTATVWGQQQLRACLQALPAHVIFVLDEAYIEYVAPEKLGADIAHGLPLLAEFPNLVVARTFSKIHGLASLRVGYTIAHPDFASVLERTRLSFNVDVIALHAAELSLQDPQHLGWVREQIAIQRTRVIDELRQMGLRVLPSECNFLLIDFAREASAIEQALVHEGVIVRPVRAYQLPNHLRVTIGTEYENGFFLAAMRRVLAKSI